jgi:hypothetical protein
VDIFNHAVFSYNLVKQTEFIVNSAVGFDLLFVYDGTIEYLELDLFYGLVAYWFGDLFWI